MRPVSTGFINASLSPVGFADAYLDINGTRIDASKLTEITVNENIGASGSFSIGSFNTVEATMKVLTSALPSTVAGMPIRIYFGYYVSGSYEYVPMGIFYAQPKDISHQNLFTTINAHDKSWRMTDAYVSALNWDSTHTVREVLNEVATSAEITLGTFGGLNPSNVTVYTAPKGSYRDVIAQMAMLLGTNAKLNRTGALDFIKAYPSSAVEEYGAYDYTSSGFSITSDASANYGKLTVNYKTTNSSGEEQVQTFNYTAGSGSNALVIESTNIRTQAQTNTLGQTIFGTTGLQYYGYTANLPGQPQIDLGDTISIEDVFGRTNNLLVLQATHTFNGAMKSTFNAIVNDSEPELNGNNISGSLTEQVSTINDAASYARGRAEYAASKADEASASASRAQKSADDAQTSADNAQSSADEAARQAGIATTNANEAIRQAGVATTNANEAIRQAGIATTNANEAKEQAHTATVYANSALDQLGIVQDVIGVLNWAVEHGTFTSTTDTTVQEGKVYFTYDSSTGDYTPVVTPADNPRTAGYYELTVDEAMESFIMSHLAVTARGLWVLPNGYGTATNAQYAPNYKVLLASDGLYIYDGDGVLVSKYGESITFSSTRQQTIGNNQAYIVFDPEGASGQGTLTIGGATINMSGKTLDEILAEKLDNVDVTVTQTSTGANITVNGQTASISNGTNGQRGGKTLKTTTAPSSYTTKVGSFTPSYRIALSTVKTQSGSSDVIVGDVIEYSTYHYPVGYVDSSYVYTAARVDFKGATGGQGPQGEQGPKGDTGDQGPQGNSVTSLTPYYQLGTSKPAKPSDNTQPTGWSTTQPAVDTTKTCYVTVQAIYSNGDIKYSDVSTLSEYEASKESYSKALDAESKANANAEAINGSKFYQYTPTYSGAIATFNANGGTSLRSLVVNIEPKQSGTGDPSPSNVRPISGWDSVKVTECGKNLIGLQMDSAAIYYNGVTASGNNDRLALTTTNTSAWRNMSLRVYLKAGTYTLSIKGESSDSYEPAVTVYNSSGTAIAQNAKQGSPKSFTLAEYQQVEFRFFVSANPGAIRTVTYYDVQLEFGSTATTYEPYQGETITTNLPQTVYGGVLDVVSGKLNINMAVVDMGSLTWSYDGTAWFKGTLTGAKPPADNYAVPNAICSNYTAHAYSGLASGQFTIIHNNSSARGNVWVKDSAYTSASAFKTAMNGVQLVYELATPTEIQLTPTEVKTLLGANNVWADSGNVSVSLTFDVTEGSDGTYYYFIGSDKLNVAYSDLDTENGEPVIVSRDGFGNRINAVQNDVITAQSTADDASAKADSANTKANEVNTALEDYKDSNDEQIGILKGRLALEESASSELQTRTDKAEAYITALQNSYDKYNSFIEISPNVPSIALGKRNDDSVKSKVEVTGTSVNIWSEDKITAYASGQAFNAPEGVFENVTMINANGTGNLRWIARSNGHLSLKVVK